MSDSCPSDTDLRLFAEGGLGDDRLAEIGLHLDGCAHCRKILDAAPPPFASNSFPIVLHAVVTDSMLERTFELVHLIPAPSGDEPPDEPAPPTHFGRFRVVERLGGGSMGTVYAAEDEQLGRRVAVKVLRPAFASRAGARDRFLREARATAALDHPNVVSILDVGETENGPYLVMELLAGESLGARLRRARVLPVEDAVRVGREVAAGLTAAHAAGLIHRDVTPDNIWLTADGPAKLLDFGLVRAGTDAAATTPGTIIGTPRYMSPEQARADAVDARADIFGLGAVLYHAVTGTFPYPGKDTLAVLTALAVHTPEPADRVNPDVPRRLAQLLARMMAKSPDERPPTAAAVADELADSLAPPHRLRWWWLVAPLLALLAGAVWAATRPPAGAEEPTAPELARKPDADPRPKPPEPEKKQPEPPSVAPKKALQPPPVDDPPLPTDPDRVAAEWALDGSGFAQIIIAFGESSLTLCTQSRADEPRGLVDRRSELPKSPYQIVSLNVNRSRAFKDADAVHLRGLKHLTFLQISNVRATDAILPHLRHSTKVEEIKFHGTAITDDGLPHLEGFTELRALNVRQTRVTDLGLRKLAAVLPKCRIEWNGGFIEPQTGDDKK